MGEHINPLKPEIHLYSIKKFNSSLRESTKHLVKSSQGSNCRSSWESNENLFAKSRVDFNVKACRTCINHCALVGYGNHDPYRYKPLIHIGNSRLIQKISSESPANDINYDKITKWPVSVSLFGFLPYSVTNDQTPCSSLYKIFIIRVNK
jgi:hypothetical protein